MVKEQKQYSFWTSVKLALLTSPEEVYLYASEEKNNSYFRTSHIHKSPLSVSFSNIQIFQNPGLQ